MRKKAKILWEEKPQDDPRNATTDVKVAETKNGKGIRVYRDSDGYWKISFSTGGELPPEFDQKFTLQKHALHQVELYLLNG